jgi:hypothetical protein
VTIERWLDRRRAAGRRPLATALTAGVVVAGLIGVPFSLPVLPASVTAGSVLGLANPDQLETIGWPELVETVAQAHRELPPQERENSTILTVNYGEAGAIERFGATHELP